MKKLVKRVFSSLGYEVRKMKVPEKSKGVNKKRYEISSQNDDDFNIQFSHVVLDGSHYFAPKYALHRPAVSMLLKGTLYEPDTHEFVKSFFSSYGGSMIHAGTFYGDMIPNFARAVSGKVYAFEPVLENYVLAKLCVDRNELSNVVLVNSALSDDLCNLHIDTNLGDGSGKHAGGASTISKTGEICTAIDIDRLGIQDLALLQLDVEGHELLALKGAKETISRCRPVVAIEDNSNNCSEFLRGLDYEAAGEIPGLNIWIPIENDEYKEMISTFWV